VSPKQPQTPPAPLTDVELIKVIQASGYPLEMALYDEFEQAGMDPALGLIMRTSAPNGTTTTTHEIDLMARLGKPKILGKLIATASVTAWIDAKQLPMLAHFVGILGVQPNPHERRVNRSIYSGCPSFQVLEREEPNTQLFIGPGGFSETLDPLSDNAPLCVHWGIAKPDGSGQNWKLSGDGGALPAGVKDDRFYQSMSKLVAAVVWHERETSEYFENGVDVNMVPLPALFVLCPTLIVDTPTLPVYDAKTQTITHVDWFMLRWGAEINGKVHYRIIDIVTRAGVQGMIARYKKTEEALAAAIAKHGNALAEAGRAIRGAKLRSPFRTPP
jgi:hypothetical protein